MVTSDFLSIVGVIVASVVVLLRAISDFRSSAERLETSEKEIADAVSKVAEQPEKAKPAWDLARATLEAYFNRNLFQIASIFWLSVFVMIVGFGIIVWGISYAVRLPTTLGPAAIASLSGLITEFIGATFLFIYRSTIQQAINYSRTLERINSVGMAMQILDTMPDNTQPDDLKSKTKATLVELLVRQSYELSTKERDETKEANPRRKTTRRITKSRANTTLDRSGG
jgi:hypothetical protein